MTDSEGDSLIETEENANIETKRLVQEIVVAALTREISTWTFEDNIVIHKRACNVSMHLSIHVLVLQMCLYGDEYAAI